MTKERKIEILKDLLIQLSDSANILCTCEADKRCEVVEECIKSLKQPDSDACVNRQATLDAIIKELCIKDESYLLQSEKVIYNVVKNMPPVTPTFPKGATNGDMIKAMFPNIEANEVKTDTGGYIEVKYLDTTDKRDATAFRKSWWNAPYKGVENGSN